MHFSRISLLDLATSSFQCEKIRYSQNVVFWFKFLPMTSLFDTIFFFSLYIYIFVCECVCGFNIILIIQFSCFYLYGILFWTLKLILTSLFFIISSCLLTYSALWDLLYVGLLLWWGFWFICQNDVWATADQFPSDSSSSEFNYFWLLLNWVYHW